MRIFGFCNVLLLVLAGCSSEVHTDGHISNYIPDSWFRSYDRASGFPDINSIPERSALRPPSLIDDGRRFELERSQDKLNDRNLPMKREDNDPDWNG